MKQLVYEHIWCVTMFVNLAITGWLHRVMLGISNEFCKRSKRDILKRIPGQ